jgi:TRAP-type C4-dicarboxylate transport system permease small subunit
MVLFVFINTVLRYGFNSGIPAAEELARFLFVWTVFFGAILAYQEGRHVNVDLLVSMFKGSARKIIITLSYLSVLAVCGIMAWGGWQYLILSSSTFGSATGISFAFVSVSFFIATIAMFIQTILKFKDDMGLKGGK